MWYYKCYYGNWRDAGHTGGVKVVDQSYNRKEIFGKARETANAIGEVVTVSAKRGSPNGLIHKYYKFEPGADQPTIFE